MDVNEFFKCEYDYTNCGFLARIKKENIDLKNGQYQIIFKGNKNNYDNDIQSNSYIDKGKLKNNIRSFKPSNSFKQKAKETLKKIDQKTKLNMSEKNKMVEFVEKLHVGLSTSKTIKKELLEYVGKYYDELEKVFKISLDEIEAYLEELDIEEIYNVE